MASVECKEYADGYAIYDDGIPGTMGFNCDEAWSNWKFEQSFKNSKQPAVCGIENPEQCESCQ